MFASLECDDVDSLVNETLPNWPLESAQNMIDFDHFFNIEEQEETESHTGISSLSSEDGPQKRKAAKSRKSPIISKLYQPLNKVTGLPNKGRAKSSKALRVFPVFDQSAALPNLPTTMTMLINSGNLTALSRLLYSHLDKDCKVNLSVVSESSITIRSMLKFVNFITAMNPDLIMCVQATKVDGLRIKASIYKKCTLNNLIYDVASKSVVDPAILTKLGQNRSEFIQQMIASETTLNDDIKKVRDVAETDQDLLIYARLEMEMIVDDKTKLVSHFTVTHQISSIEPVEQLSKLE